MLELPRDWEVRFNENHDPDTGQFSSGDGGGGGGSSDVVASSSGNTSTASSGGKKAKAADEKISAPVVTAAEHIAATSGAVEKQSGKPKLEDFAKDKVNLVGLRDKDRQTKFVDEWDSRVGGTPAEFKQAFLGGVDATMNIDPQGDKWEITGLLLSPSGQRAGEYRRSINWRTKTAESEFFAMTSSATGKNTGKKLLAGNVETYRKLGIEKVTVHANIDVGGYAWAKYGYVPTRSSWSDLSSKIARKLGGSGTSRSTSSDSYTPEEWVSISDDDQSNIKDAWMRSTREEFLDSEITSWRDQGEDLHRAKTDLAENFNNTVNNWARDAIKEVRKDHDGEIPYTDAQILDALSITYDEDDNEGRKDAEFEFDDTKLQEPSNAPPPEQMTLPGIDAPDLASHLTDDMRTEITDALVTAFNDTAEEDRGSVEAPEYLADNVAEYQGEVWDNMSERERYRWAENNSELPSYNIENDEEHDDEPVYPETDEVADDLKTLADSSDPKAIWAIADSASGKDLLLNSDWYGVLNLKDKETMDRFNSYVGKAKVPNDVAA